MPFTTILCPKCRKPAESQREFHIGDKIVCSLKCGHLLEKSQLNQATPEAIESTDNKKLYKFQCDGVKFIEQSDARCLIADEMGLGKTVQAVAALSLHKELLPFLWIGKAALKQQYQYELLRWGNEDFFAQVIDSPKDFILPGMKGYIMSYDVIPRFAKKETNKKKKALKLALAGKKLIYDTTYCDEASELSEAPQTELGQQKSEIEALVKKMKIQTVILDECQQIKNHESQRAVFIRELCKHVPHVIGLSGTPIKNNASEYFSILNILKPELYRNFAGFMRNECDSYFNGYAYKVGGLRFPDRFMDKTKGFIIRRDRKQVMPDLPPIVRNFEFCDLAKEVEEEYLATLKDFQDEYNSSGLWTPPFQQMAALEKSSSTLAYMSKMRHLTGLSKINPCIDHVMELMGSTNDRVTIFIHHLDVAEMLERKLNTLFAELNVPKCATHKSGDSSIETQEKFAKTRVLICSTLAGGEGLNLQHLCSRFIMLERQWNPANEEQAEARFPRPEGLRVESIEGTYFVATGTIDELLSELVEQKRAVVSSTLDNRKIQWDQSSLMKELAEALATQGGKKWRI